MTRYVPTLPASQIALFLANLVPLAGVAFFGWTVLEVLAVYWSENVVIGGFMILRLLANPALSPRARLGLPLFFGVHFVLFCVVHAVFVVALAGDGSAPAEPLGQARPVRALPPRRAHARRRQSPGRC